MPATFSWEREWLREASLHELSARALCDVALPGVAAAKMCGEIRRLFYSHETAASSSALAAASPVCTHE